MMEVETPILWNSVGGAVAKPFITHHTSTGHLQHHLERNEMYLRIAPELFLKRLVISGFDSVFEIGKVFRNEGLSPKHNPEFTTCEAYQAYATLDEWIDFSIKFINEMMLANGKELLKFKKVDIVTSLEEKLNTKLPLKDDEG